MDIKEHLKHLGAKIAIKWKMYSASLDYCPKFIVSELCPCFGRMMSDHHG